MYFRVQFIERKTVSHVIHYVVREGNITDNSLRGEIRFKPLTPPHIKIKMYQKNYPEKLQ
jgi:hypothetical protein